MTKEHSWSYRIKFLILKLYLKIKGVRFYETEMKPNNEAYNKLSVKTINGKSIEFYFHIERLTDMYYSYKGFNKKEHKFYLIIAKFDDSFTEELKRFNNLKIFVSSKEFLFDNDDLVSSVLIGIYLDFILLSLKNGSEVE